MIRGFYTARSGLLAHQEHMSIMGNNLANTNTVGFKPERAAFKDLIYQNLNRVRNENAAQTGHGVKINKTDIMFHQGAPKATGRELDFCITDANAFFQVETAEGELRYTRAGNFYMSNQEDTWFLINGNGDYVLDTDGERIEIEFNEYQEVTQPGKGPPLMYEEDQLDANGDIIHREGDYIRDENGNVQYGDAVTQERVNPNYGDIILDPGSIALYTFPNKWGLDAMDGTRFVQTEISGEPVLLEPTEVEASNGEEFLDQPAIRQGYVESSSTEIANEMAEVIQAQRAFSFNSKMVQVADEIEQTVNSLRG